MLEGIELLGLADSVNIQGDIVSADPGDSLVAFRFLGWSPSRNPDDTQCEYIMRAMAAFGNGLSDGKLTPVEAVTIVASAYPEFKHAHIIEAAISLTEDVFNKISEDGKLTWNESFTIVVSVFRKLIRGG